MKIVIETLQDYLREKYVVHTHCWKCGKFGKPLNLAALCARGYGATRLSAYKPECEKCGETLQKVVQPPEKPGLLKDGRPIAYR